VYPDPGKRRFFRAQRTLRPTSPKEAVAVSRILAAAALIAGVAILIRQEKIMSSIAEVNQKIDELVKDVRRVLTIVTNDQNVGGATQAEVDALAERLDAFDAEVEAVSPEPTPQPEPANDEPTVPTE
jgi:hypothetical protein